MRALAIARRLSHNRAVSGRNSFIVPTALSVNAHAGVRIEANCFLTGKCHCKTSTTRGPRKTAYSIKMKNHFRHLLGGLALAAMLAGAQTARANFGGKIFCDANCNGVFTAPLGGVTVNAYFCGTATLAGSTVSGADGSYAF